MGWIMSAKKFHRELLRKFPNRVMAVELTNLCNLNCPLCSTGSGFNKKPKGMMKLDDFKRVMEKLSFMVDEVSFIGSGEPFLHPDFIRFVKYTAKEKGKRVNCYSNGMLIGDFDAIVRSGLNSIWIDVDGITQAQHQKYRIGSDLNQILRNIENLVLAKKNAGAYYPRIYFDTLISRYNENDYEHFIDLAKKVGADGIRLRGITDDIYKKSDWFPVQDKFKVMPRQDDSYDCSFKDTWAGILSWDGEVQLCCMSPHHDVPVIKTNVFKDNDVIGQLNSDKFYRLTKLAGKHPFCKTCSLAKYTFYEKIINFDSSAEGRYKNNLFGLINAILEKASKLWRNIF